MVIRIEARKTSQWAILLGVGKGEGDQDFDFELWTGTSPFLSKLLRTAQEKASRWLEEMTPVVDRASLGPPEGGNSLKTTSRFFGGVRYWTAEIGNPKWVICQKDGRSSEEAGRAALRYAKAILREVRTMVARLNALRCDLE